MKNYLGLLIAFLVVSCGGTNTIMLDSWKDAETTIERENFKKVVVVGMVKNELVRKRIESRFKEIDPIFHTSNQFLNEKTGIDKEMLVKLLKSENVDGVLTMRLVDVSTETDYVPGITSTYYNTGLMSPFGYGDMFGNWYGMYAPLYYSPGYYVENKYYTVETNIFSLKNNKLIWSAVTKTQAFSDIEGGLDDILTALVKQMRKDGSLAPEKK